MSNTETSDTDTSASGPEAGNERVPAMQRMLDNPFLLLFLGVTMPTVLYIIWGIMELVQIPVSPP